jgi:hypothetical protein
VFTKTQPSSSSGADAQCLICDTVNSHKAVVCKECSAPMQLVHDVAAQKRDPCMISIVGDSNVGKTVYLGFLLDMLAQRACDFEAVPKGAYSVDLPQTVISHMAYRIFPPKTPVESHEWRWAYYHVRRQERASPWVDLIMPDLAGEAIVAELTSPSTFRVIRNLLKRSAGMMLLVDAALAASGSPQPDFFALKMLSYLDSMFGGKREERVSLPIAMVLCKADHCPQAFEDPPAFVEANLNRVWNLINSRYERVEFFACSVVGSLGYATASDNSVVRPVPLHTALRGVLEPFEWMLAQL